MTGSDLKANFITYDQDSQREDGLLAKNTKVQDLFSKIAIYQRSYPFELLESFHIQNSPLKNYKDVDAYRYGYTSFSKDFRKGY